MQYLTSIVEQHALLVVFLNIFLAGCGLPLPVFPTLMTVAAIAGHGPSRMAEIVAAGGVGALAGDFIPYWCGRRFGRHVLAGLCRVSISPDFCVRRTEVVFAKIGTWSLLFAKFLPGFSLISVTMAGISKMPVPLFMLIDGTGKLFYVSVAVTLGRVFRNAIASVIATLTEFGEFGIAALVGAFALYMLARWFRRQLFIRQLRMDRITVDELRHLLDRGEMLTILDVRPKEVRVAEGTIPGAIAAHPSDDDPVLNEHPRDTEIVVYCDCPNEASAAIAAKHLKQAGFKKIRPLLGGITAWVEAGHPIAHSARAIDEPQEGAGRREDSRQTNLPPLDAPEMAA